MRTFYIMAAVAVVAVAIVLMLVLGKNTHETPGGSSVNTTSAAAGSGPDCDKLTGSEKERCLARKRGK